MIYLSVPEMLRHLLFRFVISVIMENVFDFVEVCLEL